MPQQHIPGSLDLLISNVSLVGYPEAVNNALPYHLGILGQRIVWIGQHLPSEIKTRRHLDLAGHLVCPGFINMHYHAGLNFVRGVAPDEGFAPSYTKTLPQATQLTTNEAMDLATLGAVEALKAGSTTLVDSFVHVPEIVPALAAAGGRIFASPRLNDVDFASVLSGQRRFDSGRAQTLLDGAESFIKAWNGRESNRIRAHLTAHAPDTCSPDFLQAVSALACAHGLRLSTHLAQSSAEVDWIQKQYGCSPVSHLARLNLLNGNLLAGHCIHVDDEDIAMLADSGTHIVHIPLGNAVSGRFAPTSKQRAAGCRLSLGTDTMHGDMIEAMRWALAIGRIQDNAVSPHWQPDDVLTMGTVNGAAALGMEHELGRIRVGHLADLVIINMRQPHLTPAVKPLGTLVHNGTGGDVAYVIVDGRIVVEKGHCVLVDEEAVVARASAATQAVWARHQIAMKQD